MCFLMNKLRYPQFSPRCLNTETLALVRDNSVMYDTTKLISIGFVTLC